MAAASKEHPERRRIVNETGGPVLKPFLTPKEKKLLEEEALYDRLAKTFRRLAIPIFLVTMVVVLDHFLQPELIQTKVEDFGGYRKEQVITADGKFLESADMPKPLLQREFAVTLEKTPVLGVITHYGSTENRVPVRQSFHDFILITFLTALLAVYPLITSNRDHRMFTGALALVLLIVQFIVYVSLS